MKLFVLPTLIFVAFIAFGYHKFNEWTKALPLSKFDTNKFWGKGDASKYKPNTSIKPFKIQIENEVIADLQKQLNRSLKLAEPLEEVKFQYGFNGDALQQIVDYWRDDYLPRWNEREEYLNSLPQYTTEIQGLRIHFIHAKPTKEQTKEKKVVPLLLLHGWPGSVREFYDFIPILTNSSGVSDFVFEVVAPSLVGYGWSQAAPRRGFNAAEMAIVMRNLMLRLGYERFLVQGGDWGSIIGSHVATIFPENVIGYHSNMCVLHTPLAFLKSIVASYQPEKYLPSQFFYEHHFPVMTKLKMLIEESGYFHIQATKPDTVGHALTTSPVGLAGYIAEKFQTVTGPGLNQNFQALYTVYSLDAVLDNIMIYYLTNSATTAGRFYAENTSKEYFAHKLDRVQTPVPAGCIRFKHDLPSAIDWALRDKFTNFIHSKYVHQGGHFAAMDQPVLLYLSFVEFVSDIPEFKTESPDSKQNVEL